MCVCAPEEEPLPRGAQRKLAESEGATEHGMSKLRECAEQYGKLIDSSTKLGSKILSDEGTRKTQLRTLMETGLKTMGQLKRVGAPLEDMGFKTKDELNDVEIRKVLSEIAPKFSELEAVYQEAIGMYGLYLKKKTSPSASSTSRFDFTGEESPPKKPRK